MSLKNGCRGYNPVFRKVNDELVRTDSNIIIDLHRPNHGSHALAEDLIHMVGVVEHGLFLAWSTLSLSVMPMVPRLSKHDHGFVRLPLPHPS